jgi:predicted glutamine amidotransferase
MCQLLAMSCKQPATINFSFEGFATRGGRTDEHQDGWGIAFFEDEGCRMFLDAQPACSSPVAELIRQYPIKSRNVIAHIRKATEGSGGVALQNCHPFSRELWGRPWIFAHNGNVNPFVPPADAPAVHVPIGQTDSERAFCYILNRLRAKFAVQPPLDALQAELADMAAQIAQHGTFNFVLSNGQLMFAYCTTNLHVVTRRHPFTTAKLADCDMQMDFSKHNQIDDVISVIATKPLTADEVWHAFSPHELRVFHEGECIAVGPCAAQPPAVAPS